EYDAETQLYYNRARYYDPAVGRFISEDPLGLRAGINPYAYAGNDPVNGRDPSGLCGGGGGGEGPKAKAAARSAAGNTGGTESCPNGQLDIGSAVDTWFWMNYGFGLRDALNGTSGDCLFSGGGSISCSAGGVTHAGYGGNSTGLRRPPSLFFIADRQFLGCPDRVAGITGGGRLYQGTHVTVPTLLFRLTGDPGLYLLTRNYRGHIEAYGTGDVVLFDGDVEGEAQCWFAPHGLFISTEWRSN
ncbi:MAG TPA: RHS repeat-associated core domain-containing protein, partial [Nitrospirales bacterium]